MDYVRLGKSGLQVSKLTLGCMSYGEPGRGAHEWTLPEEESRSFIRKALDLGINFLDTANVYSDGSSEEIVGRAIKDFARRDEIVLATKVYGRMRPGPNGMGLSRKAILAEIDNSLRRLQTDYVDLYQVHFWDHATPIEETLEALDAVVRSGKARYIGASNMYAWQFAKALAISEQNGWAKFVSMQNQLNLLYREEEREMMPLCRSEGIGVMPFSPLARGKLARNWDEQSARSETDQVTKRFYGNSADADRQVVEAVTAVAKARGVNMAQVGMAWVLQHPGVTSPIVGATKQRHLDDAVAAMEIVLTPDEISTLEQAYVPHQVVGLN